MDYFEKHHFMIKSFFGYFFGNGFKISATFSSNIWSPWWGPILSNFLLIMEMGDGGGKIARVFAFYSYMTNYVLNHYRKYRHYLKYLFVIGWSALMS